MLLGNNLWSLKAANTADLALLVFHFGECSSSSLPTYLSLITVSELKFFITAHLSTYTTSPYSSFPPHASPHRNLLLLVAFTPRNFPSPPPLSPCPLLFT